MRRIAITVAVVIIGAAAGAGLVLGLTGGDASGSWRNNCVDSWRLRGPDEAMRDDETGAKWVCDKADGTQTVVITYADALGVSAEEQKDMSMDLGRASGFGDQVVDDGPTWIEVDIDLGCEGDPPPPECRE